MRQLKIDLAELELAFESDRIMISYFLDTETGEVVNINVEERGLLESIRESYYDEQTGTVDWEAAFEKEDIPDWQRERLIEIDQLDEASGSRFIAIPSESSREGYHDMEAFIETIRNPRLQERLERAISGRGAFRHFKDALLNYPEARERWFQFKREQLKPRMLDWLEEQGIALL